MPNFHLAYWHARPTDRWYPKRHLPGPEYLRQWVVDHQRGCARARTQAEVADPGFRNWLVDRGYATKPEVATLDAWLNRKIPRDQVHVRPGVRVFRSWSHRDVAERDIRGEFATEVRESIDQVLAALGEPALADLRLAGSSGSRSSRRPPGHSPVAAETPCPTCFMTHAGDCF